MARRPQNRMELRRQYEAAEPPDPVEDESEDVIEETDEEEERRPKKKRAPAKSKAKAAAKPAKPTARMRIVWAVVNDAFKTVATFEFNQKEAALAKAAEMTAKGKGTHFIQKVKEAIAEDAPGLGASIPREAAAPKSAKAAPVAAVEVEVEEEEEEEEENHDDEDEGHDDEDD